MKYKYRKVPDLGPTKKWTMRPYLEVRLFCGDKSERVLSLVDSGADYCLFHSSLAEALGIDLRTGVPKEFGGISAGEPVQAYLHKIQMEVQGFDERIELEAAFADSDAIGGLLGQVGFFDSYKVTIERYKGRFQLEKRPAS